MCRISKCTLIFVALAQPALAQFRSLSDFDPFNKNSGIRQLGRDIDKKRLKIMTPRPRSDSTSGLTVMSYKVDKDGYIYESSRSDRPYVKTRKRADLRHSSSGRAYWYFAGKKYEAHKKYDKQRPQPQTPRERYVGINVVLENGTPAELLFTLHFQPQGARPDESLVFHKRQALRPRERAVWTIPAGQGLSIVDVRGTRFYRLMVESIDPNNGRKHFWGPNPQRPGLTAFKVTKYQRRNGNYIDQYTNVHIGVN